MMKSLVAVIGGSFDPPTIAHALMAAELLNQKIVNKVVYVPCGTREDKPL
jgi:nicotinic acid mononucleotide adenylyltransferase